MSNYENTGYTPEHGKRVIVIDCLTAYIPCEFYDDCYIEVPLDSIGKEYFFTREETENKLKKNGEKYLRRDIMQDFPDNITRIEVLKLDKASKKICKCSDIKYTVDSENRLVYCDYCGAIIEPFKAIENLSIHMDTLSDELKFIFEQKKKILNYKPHLEIFKNMEYNYTHGKVACCPHCNEMFDFKEIYNWGSVLFYEIRKKKNN